MVWSGGSHLGYVLYGTSKSHLHRHRRLVPKRSFADADAFSSFRSNGSFEVAELNEIALLAATAAS
jgi:hypothetical protein